MCTPLCSMKKLVFMPFNLKKCFFGSKGQKCVLFARKMGIQSFGWLCKILYSISSAPSCAMQILSSSGRLLSAMPNEHCLYDCEFKASVDFAKYFFFLMSTVSMIVNSKLRLTLQNIFITKYLYIYGMQRVQWIPLSGKQFRESLKYFCSSSTGNFSFETRLMISLKANAPRGRQRRNWRTQQVTQAKKAKWQSIQTIQKMEDCTKMWKRNMKNVCRTVKNSQLHTFLHDPCYSMPWESFHLVMSWFTQQKIPACLFSNEEWFHAGPRPGHALQNASAWHNENEGHVQSNECTGQEEHPESKQA